RHIVQVAKQLMLHESILDQRFDQCSGGEQKRIAIGQELMAAEDRQPSLLIVDEPTTGLDSASALEVIRCLANLASSHQMAIIVSIHVPNDAILKLFDKLYILAKGGVCVYSGAPALIRSHLEEHI